MRQRMFFLLIAIFIVNKIYSQSINNPPVVYQILDSIVFDNSTDKYTIFWSDNFGMQFNFDVNSAQNKFLFCPINPKEISFPMVESGKADYLEVTPWVSTNIGCAKEIKDQGENALVIMKESNHDEFKGRILILVESTLALNIQDELAILNKDLVGEGYQVGIKSISASMKPSDVKSVIKDYKAEFEDLTSLYLIGDIAFAASGNYNLDGHDDHKGAQLADYYYADLIGNWTDTIDFGENVPNSNFLNSAGDGNFDQNNFSVPPQLEIGRAFFSNLPVFNMSEVALTKRYLNKVHHYRTKRKKYDFTFFEGMTNTGFNPLYQYYYGYQSIKKDVLFNSNILSALKDNSVLIGISNNTGGPDIQHNSFSSAYLVNNRINADFMFLTGSYFYDLRYKNNLIRCLLASESPTISVYWSFFKNIGTPFSALGYTMGRSFITKLNSSLINKTVSNLYTGDPSVKLIVLDQITNLNLSAKDNKVIITWDTHSDPDIQGYKVYRSDSLNGKYTLLTSKSISANSYEDIVNSVGKYFYMVRAVKLEKTRLSSYYNYSTGAIESIKVNSISRTNNHVVSKATFTPNPIENIGTLISHEIGTVVIYNSLGQPIYRNNNIQIGENIFDLSTLSSGLLYMKIDYKHGQSDVLKLFKL